MTRMLPKLIGIDGSRDGWLCVERSSEMHMVWISKTFEDVIDRTGSDSLIGIDIPIGLPPQAPENAISWQGKCLGNREGAVHFPPPFVACFLLTTSHAHARYTARLMEGQ